MPVHRRAGDAEQIGNLLHGVLAGVVQTSRVYGLRLGEPGMAAAGATAIPRRSSSDKYRLEVGRIGPGMQPPAALHATRTEVEVEWTTPWGERRQDWVKAAQARRR